MSYWFWGQKLSEEQGWRRVAGQTRWVALAHFGEYVEEREEQLWVNFQKRAEEWRPVMQYTATAKKCVTRVRKTVPKP